MQALDPDLAALQEVRDLVERAARAQESVARFSQEKIDAVCDAMAKAAARAAYELAKLAVEETGIGRVHHKILKNLFGAEGTWASIKAEKTVGIVLRDEKAGVLEVATPAGVIAGIVPTTNPTSTAIFKALVSVKGRNAIVISPHPRARRCIGETVEVLRRAVERAGAPADLVLALSNPTIESTGALMKHKKVALILATGGSGLVQAAYSSGKPAYGVGPGNVPAYVDRSADVERAARWLVDSQSFDNGTLCCSEQGIVLDRPIAGPLLDALQRRGAHLCDEAETKKLEKLCNVRGHMNPDVVGLDPWKIAEKAGFSVPRETSVLLAHQAGVGKDHPLSIEILAPILSVHVVDGWEEGCRVSIEMLEYGGLGHTLGLWAKDPKVQDAWFLEKPANRIVVNGPTSEGAVGYSTNLLPSMSLGCGPQAGNITSDNISARHLVNIKRVAFPKRDWDALHAADHARAAALGGDRAPRGSGLPGDPALGVKGPARAADGPRTKHSSDIGAASEPRSNWQGNPPVLARPDRAGVAPSRMPPQPRAERAGGALSTSEPRPAELRAAPRFTGPASAVLAQPASPSRPSARPDARTLGGPARAATFEGAGQWTSAPAFAAGPFVGMTLTPAEIEGILAHAGAGCPLGPCRGCPHNEVQTGACLA